MCDGKKRKTLSYRFHCMSMKKKLCITFALLFLISFLALFSIYIQIYRRDLTDSQYDLFEQMTVSCQTIMDNMIEHVDYIARAPLFSKQIQDDMIRVGALRNESLELFEQTLSVLGTDEQYKYVILLYNREKKIVYSSFSLENGYLINSETEHWYEAAVQANGKTILIPFVDERNKYSCVALKLIKDTSTLEELGVMAIALPRELLDDVCETIFMDMQAHVLLKNTAEETIYIYAGEADAEIIAEGLRQLGDHGKDDAFTETADFLISTKTEKKYSILIFSQKETVMQELYRTQILLNAIWIVGVLVVVTATVRFSGTIIRPLRRITELMGEVKRGDMSVRFPAKYTDEVGILGQNFNEMLERINEMTTQMVEAQTVRCKVEIDALKGQIQPHFIYNILETFHMMALEEQNDELADLILRFGRIMRYNITLMNEITTIRQEVEYLQNYLYIQNSRYKNRIDFICCVSEELMDTHIIKLLLEPVVENAIIHGFEANADGDHQIELSGYETDDARVFEITDNGMGMTDASLNELRSSLSTGYLEAKSTKSIGLRNVNERIRLYYGVGYGIRIESEVGKKTTVSLRIPKEEGEYACIPL